MTAVSRRFKLLPSWLLAQILTRCRFRPKSSSRHGTNQKSPEDDHQSASPEHSDEHVHETVFQTADSVLDTSMGSSDLGQLAAYNEPAAAGSTEDQGMDLSACSQNVDLALNESNVFNFGATTSCIPGQ